jgi:hypothetical protein
MFSRILLKSVIQIVEFRLMPATGYRLRVVVKDCEQKNPFVGVEFRDDACHFRWTQSQVCVS